MLYKKAAIEIGIDKDLKKDFLSSKTKAFGVEFLFLRDFSFLLN